ncbi:hypothetical protein [Litchfieldella rifensis]|uniref:YfhG lipoprotein n=1 Tax=Litchfieldella rifensis TaxID=762643 RepID=A0ABV7LU22_9GAMM
MHYRILSGLLAASLLTGCQWLPEQPDAASQETAEKTTCDEVIPTLVESDCLVEAWIDYGLASQRGDREWRDRMLESLESLKGKSERLHLARAVALSWGSEQEWSQAAELYRNNLHAAPSDLQPLFRYWFNELEGRRAMGERLASSEAQRYQLATKNKELAAKLEALTDIEQNINLRQQSP